MMGLILKDYYSLKNYLLKQLLVGLVVCLVVSVIIESAGFLPIMLMLMTVNASISAFAIDESAKWDGYALTLPLTRAQIVLARYLFAAGSLLLTGAVGAVLGILLDSIVFHAGALEVLGATAGVFLVYLLMNVLSLPVYYKMGVEKARLITIILYLVPFAIFVGILPSIDLTVLEALPLGWIAAGFAAAVLLLAVLSCLLSVRIYRGKEF